MAALPYDRRSIAEEFGDDVADEAFTDVVVEGCAFLPDGSVLVLDNPASEEWHGLVKFLAVH